MSVRPLANSVDREWPIPSIRRTRREPWYCFHQNKYPVQDTMMNITTMTPRRRVSDHRGNRELKLVPTPVLVQWSFQAKVARLLHNSWIDYRSAVVEFPSNSALLIHQITLRFLPFRLLPVPFIPPGWVIPLGKARGTVRLLSVFSNQGHSRSLWRSNAEPSPILTSPAH